MDIRQVNELLRPYKITIECGNCTLPAFHTYTPMRKSKKERNSSKMKKKIQKKSFPKNGRRKDNLKHKIFNSDIKSKQISHSPFVNFTKRFSAQKENDDDDKELCLLSFFAEIKKQKEDGLKTFPDLENLNTHNEWKQNVFEPNTASTMIKIDRTPVSFGKNLFETNGNMFGAENKRKLMLEIERSPFLLKEDRSKPFELNFKECRRFSEFLGFD